MTVTNDIISAWPIPSPNQIPAYLYYNNGRWEDNDFPQYAAIGISSSGSYAVVYIAPYGWLPMGCYSDKGNEIIIRCPARLASEGFAIPWPVVCPVSITGEDSVEYSGHQWTINGRFYEADGTEFFEEEEELPSGLVHPYSVNVPQLLGVTIPEELCLGIEAEFLSSSEDKLLLSLESAERKAIFKADSSCGVELVSVPLPPAEMLEYISNLKIAQLGTDSKCGVHIHLSRKYLSQYQIGFLVMFMHCPFNLKYITEVAGREPNRYCKQVPHKLDTDSNDRYEMVNLTNPNTIEVRIFAGTNDTQVLQGYVTWLLQLLEWAGTYPTNCASKEFLTWLESKQQPTPKSIPEQPIVQTLWKRIVSIAMTRLF